MKSLRVLCELKMVQLKIWHSKSGRRYTGWRARMWRGQY